MLNIPGRRSRNLGFLIGAFLGGLSFQVCAQSLLVIPPSGQKQAAEAAPPDFNGDGIPDYFELMSEPAGARESNLLKDTVTGVAMAHDSASPTCIHVAIRTASGRRTQQNTFCADWKIETFAAPSRGPVPGRQSWVVRLTPELGIPQVGHLHPSRDAVLLQVDGTRSALFYDGTRFVLHQGLDLHKVVFHEALEALSRFEQDVTPQIRLIPTIE